MKVAKLVEVSLVVRVIVDENATDDDIIAASRPKFVDLCDSDSLGDNVVGWEDDEECPATKEDNWTASLCPVVKPDNVTADGYASLSIGEQLWLLVERFVLAEKEAREYRTDDIYGLPYPLASDFDGFEDSKYPDEEK